jgi:predicted nuclease of predicted toxin-antitoxin system
MARLYANENFPLPVVIELRRLGHDVLTVRESGKANRAVPDREVLEFARAEKRVVLTLNRKHFIALHALMPDHAGIVVCTVDAAFAGQALRVHESLALHAELLGRLVRVNRPAGASSS